MADNNKQQPVEQRGIVTDTIHQLADSATIAAAITAAVKAKQPPKK